MTGITILLVALVAVVAVGLFLKSRNGKVRVTTPPQPAPRTVASNC